MTGTGYGAEITVTDGQRAVSLGEVVVRNRRLALRWLRRQALRLAEGPGAQSCSERRSGGAGVRAAVLRSRTVRDGLQGWAEDHARQDEAMARLESGCPDAFTLVDPAAGLLVTLAVRRVRSRPAAAMAAVGAPPPPPRASPHGSTRTSASSVPAQALSVGVP